MITYRFVCWVKWLWWRPRVWLWFRRAPNFEFTDEFDPRLQINLILALHMTSGERIKYFDQIHKWREQCHQLL